MASMPGAQSNGTGTNGAEESFADVLLNKSRRDAGLLMKSLCDHIKSLEDELILHPTNETLACELNERKGAVEGVWERLLDPTVGIDNMDSWQNLDWCRYLVASGSTFEDYSKNVSQYDNAVTCGLVWTPNFVAYRCRTCGMSPCMSLCSECFLSGNHEGHDFNMFRSQAGGACDCGDLNVMREEGFCPKHGPAAQAQKPKAPSNLVSVAETALPKMLFRLLQSFRESYGTQDSHDEAEKTFSKSSHLLTLLQNMSDCGATLRQVMAKIICDKSIYSTMMNKCRNQPVTSKTACILTNDIYYKKALGALKSMCTSQDAESLDCPQLNAELKHESFVDELTFWLVVFEFPQAMVTFLLSLLPDAAYKEAFADAFVVHYSRMAPLIADQGEQEQLSNRVIHISVQLLSNEILATRLVNQHKLLRVIVTCLYRMMHSTLTASTVHDKEHNYHVVIDCAHPLMQRNNYWALVSDLHNLLNHAPIAHSFMRDPELVDLWCNFLSMFQGMNLNERQLEHHVEFESRTYYPAFTVEIEACAATLWSLAMQCKNEATFDCLLTMLQALSEAIQNWFEAIKFEPPIKFESPSCWRPNPLELSFHLPLHRYYAAFLSQALKVGCTVLFPSETQLRQMMMHPLQIQVARAEISANMWVRNGTAIKYQSCLYAQSHFCTGQLDLDLYMIQAVATRVHPDWFILTLFERFHLVPWFSLGAGKPVKPFLRSDWEMPMLEGALRLLATVLCNTLNMGMTERENTRLELATLLAVDDKSHSQLAEALPEKGPLTEGHLDFEYSLHEVAEYKAPQMETGGGMSQGIYVPNAALWEKYFDPIFVALRSMQAKDVQTAMDRYTDYLKRNGQWTAKENPWPPFRLPAANLNAFYEPLRRLLHCRSFHAAIFVILYKAVRDTSVSEQALYLTIFLLELAIRLPAPQAVRISEVNPSRHVVLDLQFCGWFPGNDIFTNLTHRIEKVLVINDLPGLSRAVNDGSEMNFYDLTRLNARKGSAAPTPTSLVPTTGAIMPRSRSSDIPFIDHEGDSEAEVDLYFNRVLAALPPNFRREYLPGVPELPMLTLEQEMALVPSQVGPMVATTTLHDLMDSTPAPPTQLLPILSSQVHSSSLVVAKPRFLWVKRRKFGGPAQKQLYGNEAEGQKALPSSARPPESLPAPEIEVVDCEAESMLTLLLKLYKKVKNVPYQPTPDKKLSEKRVGDAGFFVGNILDRVYAQSQKCRSEIDAASPATNVSVVNVASEASTETAEKEARKKAARERQARLMAQFTSKQKTVMKQLMEQEDTEKGRVSPIQEEEAAMAKSDPTECHQCVICSQSSGGSVERPFGLVALLQSTSVLGKACEAGTESRDITASFSASIDNREVWAGKILDIFHKNFDPMSCAYSANYCWDAGVRVTTCGHFVHTDCHGSYMDALKRDHSSSMLLSHQQALHVEKGEFNCPLCRQIANSVLPLIYARGASRTDVPRKVSRSLSQASFGYLVPEVATFLEPPHKYVEASALSNACDALIIQACNLVPRQFIAARKANMDMLINEIVRTNFELDQILRDSDLFQDKRCCTDVLLELAVRQIAGFEPTMPGLYRAQWADVTGLPLKLDELLVTVADKQIPLLLKDSCGVLLQLLLVLLAHTRRLDIVLTTCEAVFNVTFVQTALYLSLRTRKCQRMRWMSDFKEMSGREGFTEGCERPEVLFYRLLDTVHVENRFPDEGDDLEQDDSRLLTFSEGFAELKRLCVPYLKFVSTVLREVCSVELSMKLDNSPATFDFLLEFCFGHKIGSWLLYWQVSPEQLVFRQWLPQLWTALDRVPVARSIVERPLVWNIPALLRFPVNFDHLFQRFHKATCDKCTKHPKELLLCVVCGRLVCYRDSCCNTSGISEVEQHTLGCGAGTGLYFSVSTSLLLFVRGKRCGFWGSVYLDSHGEEDRSLKRGKPLFLSADRYSMLQKIWLTHAFDGACKRWTWLSAPPPTSVIPL